MSKENVEVNPYWCLEDAVSRGFNIFKGKLFNLIEATVLEEQQQLATKSLIRDFANDAYKMAIRDMRGEAQIVGILKPEELDFPETSYPLESIVR